MAFLQSSLRRRLVCGGVAALAGGFLPSLAGASSPFLDTAYPDAQGHTTALSTWAGQPIVVNFWATWCPPCVHEMPDLDALSAQFTDVAFVGLAVDTAVNVRSFNDKLSVSYPLLVVGHEGLDLMRDLGNDKGGLPFTVVFDAQGKVAERILGQIQPSALADVLTGLTT